jgi:hypothetical protein
VRTQHHPLRYLQELRLPVGERRAAQAERLAEEIMRRERENEHTAARRAARLAAECHRQENGLPSGR